MKKRQKKTVHVDLQLVFYIQSKFKERKLLTSKTNHPLPPSPLCSLNIVSCQLHHPITTGHSMSYYKIIESPFETQLNCLIFILSLLSHLSYRQDPIISTAQQQSPFLLPSPTYPSLHFTVDPKWGGLSSNYARCLPIQCRHYCRDNPKYGSIGSSILIQWLHTSRWRQRNGRLGAFQSSWTN